uniref:Uncharacterized protein n=1 Tax=Myotis myotis TaxID=51298 RepID=A0A7J7Y122_MYOMY|nr:hypothetical protein mMyoMyo1_011448 [Myotis myotis]
MLLGPTESWSMEGASGSSWSRGRTWLLPETRVLNQERAGKEFIWRCIESEASRTSKEILGGDHQRDKAGAQGQIHAGGGDYEVMEQIMRGPGGNPDRLLPTQPALCSFPSPSLSDAPPTTYIGSSIYPFI